MISSFQCIADGLQSEKHATITDQYATLDDALAFLVLRCGKIRDSGLYDLQTGPDVA
jgi:hypothetical protein